MGRKVVRPSKNPEDDKNGLDLLREIAGLPHHSVQMGKSQMRVRITDVQRDGNGRVIGSHEHIEETEIVNLDGLWSD